MENERDLHVLKALTRTSPCKATSSDENYLLFKNNNLKYVEHFSFPYYNKYMLYV